MQKKHFNSNYGKTECWYILNDGGEVYIGFKEGITKEYWKSLFDSQDIEEMLNCLHRFEVKRGDMIFVCGGVPHAIGKNCFLAELQEPTDIMVIPEKITPSGIVLSEEKLHSGLGFEKMFDCFIYDGADEETTRKKIFKEPKKITENETVLVDKTMTDKFSLVRLDVRGKYIYKTNSYGICAVVSGNADINGIFLNTGDRIFVSEEEKELIINGNAVILFCAP
ncbi:MAG: class I mannose-6-phosphate isomerase [Clostridia bacterium]|nr:class I mannose-6-phosphate isomerase [Clostridia bacterium]